jgi:hypothetical protein
MDVSNIKHHQVSCSLGHILKAEGRDRSVLNESQNSYCCCCTGTGTQVAAVVVYYEPAGLFLQLISLHKMGNEPVFCDLQDSPIFQQTVCTSSSICCRTQAHNSTLRSHSAQLAVQ